MRKDRIMVKAKCSGDLLDIRTVSWRKKSPDCFTFLRQNFQNLEAAPDRALTVSDGSSFASLRLCRQRGSTRLLEIRFTWLQQAGADGVTGYTETVRLPYDKFHAFALHEENIDGQAWSHLSIPETSRCRLEFRSVRNLHEVARRPLFRHKLGKLLEHSFQWKYSEKIVIYDDSTPFSFYFQEHTPYGPGVCGAIILSGRENPRTAVYSIHT